MFVLRYALYAATQRPLSSSVPDDSLSCNTLYKSKAPHIPKRPLSPPTSPSPPPNAYQPPLPSQLRILSLGPRQHNSKRTSPHATSLHAEPLHTFARASTRSPSVHAASCTHMPTRKHDIARRPLCTLAVASTNSPCTTVAQFRKRPSTRTKPTLTHMQRCMDASAHTLTSRTPR